MMEVNILLIAHHGIGDQIAITPTVHELKKRHSSNKLYLLITSRYQAVYDLWKYNPYVEKIVLSRLNYHPRFDNPFIFYPWQYFDIMREARQVAAQYQIDKTILIRNQYLPESLDLRIPWLPKHRVDRIAFEVGVKLTSYQYDVYWTPEHEDLAKHFLLKHDLDRSHFLVGLHTMPSRGYRHWELNDVLKVVLYFRDKYGAQFIHFHSGDSYHKEQQIDPVTLPADIVKNTAWDNIDFLTAGALIKKCKLVIAIDSSVAYLTAACRVPLVLLCRPKFPAERRLPKEGIAVGLTDSAFEPEKVIPLAENILERYS